MKQELKNKPPRLFTWILFYFIRQTDRYSLMDDLEIEYQIRAAEQGRWFASNWYLWHVIRALPELVFLIVAWRLTMFHNYIKIAFRNIWKNIKGALRTNTIKQLGRILVCNISLSLKLRPPL